MDPAFTWDQPKPAVVKARRESAPTSPSPAAARITLREAEHRFGVPVATLRTWARKGSIDAVMTGAEGTRQWVVTPESVAHHLSRGAKTPTRATPKGAKKPKTAARQATGPTGDGSAMLVPRDAWDRLIDQLGNLHETGLMLAEARERAARAETEAGFLRERLAEVRTERDALRTSTPGTAPVPRRRRRLFGRWTP
ncbi:MAG TPA: hypothetical protein VFY15_07865 [Acidimicrobiia bacterium]|nr:hypothetical protein [Acidimicrobiia bacterium]